MFDVSGDDARVPSRAVIVLVVDGDFLDLGDVEASWAEFCLGELGCFSLVVFHPSLDFQVLVDGSSFVLVGFVPHVEIGGTLVSVFENLPELVSEVFPGAVGFPGRVVHDVLLAVVVFFAADGVFLHGLILAFSIGTMLVPPGDFGERALTCS